MKRIRLHAALAAATFASTAATAQLLTEIPGSPFSFSGAANSNVLQLSADEQRLFVSNQESNTVSVFAVAPDGTPALLSVSATGQRPCGMALSPSGDRLYVATLSGVRVHAVAGDGTLPMLQALAPQVAGANPETGIQYASLPGGDFLFVNESAAPNEVTAWRVIAGGLLEWAAAYPTGGQGVVLGAYAAPRLLLFHGGHLFAGNNGSVSVFAVNGDGTLSLHPDSPFVSPLPPGPPPDPPVSPPFAPSLAADPSGEWLYAILDGVTAVRFAVADDGRLTYDAAFASGAHYPATSLAVHPSGRWMAGAFGPNGIRLWDAQAPGGPIQTIATASGLTWDAAGRRLFAGAGSLTAVRVRVFRFEGAACTSNLVISCPASVAVECTGPTTPVTSQATCSDACGPCSAACAEIQAPVGTTPVACLATSAGGVAGCTVPATVVDTKPPAIAVSASPSVLWPPDGKLIPIDLAVTVRDLCDVAPRVACRVASSEGDVDGDAVWSEGRLSLRARRAGFSPGRVYTVSCTATDVSGNSAVGQAVVLVPHDARP